MESLKKIILLIKQTKQKNKILLAAFLCLGAISFFLPNKEIPPVTSTDKEKFSSVDTYIPAGFVLVPVELANASSLGSLLSETGGVVDLYLPQGKTSLKVASKLKIIKAPYNPDLYAVLVREQESSKLLGYTGPFVAIVQNPREKGQTMIDTKLRKISIQYQN